MRAITAMLDDIAGWGFNGIWMGVPYQAGLQYYGLNPIDYYSVDPALGTMAHLEELINESHNRGIAVVAALNLGYTAMPRCRNLTLPHHRGRRSAGRSCDSGWKQDWTV